MYDMLIIGSGPAGLAAALLAKRHGLAYVVLERGVIANTIYNYPIARSLFSTSDEVEIERGALGQYAKPTREQALAHYTDLVVREQINIRTGEEVHSISRSSDGFLIEASMNQYRARSVIVAVGGFGCQRKLNVAGESAERVSYQFQEAHPYATRPVLVVGGGNSAAEAALFLAESGARVTLSIRRPSLDLPDESESITTACGSRVAVARAKIKSWVRDPLERAASEGLIDILTSSEVIEIGTRTALLKITRGEADDIVEVECDHIFALIGADPDTRLLREAGAEIGADGRPIYDNQTYETSVSGLYVAGHITRELHMKNAVEVARRVVDHIASQVLQET